MKSNKRRRFRDETSQFERHKARSYRNEHKGGFTCSHCRAWVVINDYMGTANRNHCNFCLWSKHVDIKKGDRRATCQAGMRPVGITFRIESSDRRGETMLVHACAGCDKLSINRIAADDSTGEILLVFDRSARLAGSMLAAIRHDGILLAGPEDFNELNRQLFGTSR